MIEKSYKDSLTPLRGPAALWVVQPVFRYLGDISYSIYLLHSLWFTVFCLLFPSLKLAYPARQFSVAIKLAYITLFFSFAIISTHFSYQYIELAGENHLREFF